MYRSGTHVVWKGREFRTTKTSDSKRIIISDNQKDMQIGFKRYNNNEIFTLEIENKDIEDIFFVDTYVYYEGVKCSIRVESDDSYVLSVFDMQIASEIGFTMSEKGVYYKKVLKVDIDGVVEEKRPYDIQ